MHWMYIMLIQIERWFTFPSCTLVVPQSVKTFTIKTILVSTFICCGNKMWCILKRTKTTRFNSGLFSDVSQGCSSASFTQISVLLYICVRGSWDAAFSPLSHLKVGMCGKGPVCRKWIYCASVKVKAVRLISVTLLMCPIDQHIYFYSWKQSI